METFLMRQSLSVTTVTQAFVQHFIQNRDVPSHKMSFLPNGADTDDLRPMPYDAEFARNLGIHDRKVFTFAGTHAHYQGLEVIVDAAEHLRDRDDIVILMVGAGPVRHELIDSARKKGLTNILFVDSPFEEMHRLMSITYASVVVLRDIPSSHKMRLSKAIPPLACGIPVIFAGPGETAEIIEKERCGVRVQPERPDLLAATIREFADNGELRSEMSKRGRILAEKEFTWKLIVERWYAQISSISQPKEAPVAEGTPRLVGRVRPTVTGRKV
jgi:glycosyltransferase involved in cell wall biosynthesis